MLASEIKPGMELTFSLHGSINSRIVFDGMVAATREGQFVPAVGNASVNHANIYPRLPENKKVIYADDHTSYGYIELVLVDKSIVYIGLPWIVETTIEERTTSRLDIQLADFDVSRRDELRLLLEQRGFKVASMLIVNG